MSQLPVLQKLNPGLYGSHPSWVPWCASSVSGWKAEASGCLEPKGWRHPEQFSRVSFLQKTKQNQKLNLKDSIRIEPQLPSAVKTSVITLSFLTIPIFLFIESFLDELSLTQSFPQGLFRGSPDCDTGHLWRVILALCSCHIHLALGHSSYKKPC